MTIEFASLEFAQPCQMVTEIDSVTTKFDCHHRMVNNMDWITAIKFNRHC
jgi:hypothetical protein